MCKKFCVCKQLRVMFIYTFIRPAWPLSISTELEKEIMQYIKQLRTFIETPIAISHKTMNSKLNNGKGMLLGHL
jgi:hypothetical protein